MDPISSPSSSTDLLECVLDEDRRHVIRPADGQLRQSGKV